MNPLPPSEVRRRGDRLRRRNTALAAGAGVLVAALAIGTPFVALTGDSGRGHDIQPAPSPTVPERGWVTAIPEDFPLTSGFPDEDATSGSGLSGDPNMVPICDRAGVSGFVDDRVVTYSGEFEDRRTRVLALYPDGAAAHAQVAQLERAIDRCGPKPIAEGTTAVYDTLAADLTAEESFAFTQQVQHDGGLLSDLTYVQVARTGNAVYIESSYGAAGGEQAVAAQAELLAENSAEPLARMCVFSIEGC